MEPEVRKSLTALLQSAERRGKTRLDFRHLSYLDADALLCITKYWTLLQNVEELSLECRIEDRKDAAAFCKMLKAMKQVKVVVMHLLAGSDAYFRAAIESFETLMLLERFTMYNGIVEPMACRIVGDVLGKMPKVRSITFHSTCCDDQCMDALLDGLCHSESLNELNFDMNVIEDEGIRFLADHRTLISKLASLVLSWNHIGDRGAIDLAGISERMPRLERLSLEANSISKKGALRILEALLREPWLSSMNQLNLDRCGFDERWRQEPAPNDDANGWRAFARSLLSKGPVGGPSPNRSPNSMPVTVPAAMDPAGVCPDAETLLEVLRELGRRARKQRTLEHAWRTKSDWFDEAKVDRHRVDAQDLIDNLLHAGLIESRQRGKWRQYRAILLP